MATFDRPGSYGGDKQPGPNINGCAQRLRREALLVVAQWHERRALEPGRGAKTPQFVRVEHVHVNEGGQAVVGIQSPG